ncbi:hypothetical protein WA158_007441 [Blastocystis sp. Blastoise]
MVMDTRLYDLFDVAPDATPQEIKKAFHKLALKYHPDKNPGDEEAAKKFISFKNAYDILSDPRKRDAYDKYGFNVANALDDPYAAATSPEAMAGILQSFSNGFRLFIFLFFFFVAFMIIYFPITLGLQLDGTIQWLYTCVFIPIYLLDIPVILICFYSIYTLFVYLFTYKKRKNQDSELDEDSDPIQDILSSLFQSVSTLFYVIATITVCLSLDFHYFNLTLSLIPLFIGYLLGLMSTIIDAIFSRISWSDALSSLPSVIVIVTILLSSLVYDQIATFSYFHAFIPIWVFFAIKYLLTLNLFRLSHVAKRNGDSFNGANFKMNAVASLIVDTVCFIIILCIFLKINGNTIYLIWVFVPFIVIAFCVMTPFLCSLGFLLSTPNILAQAMNMQENPNDAHININPREEMNSFHAEQTNTQSQSVPMADNDISAMD